MGGRTSKSNRSNLRVVCSDVDDDIVGILEYHVNHLALVTIHALTLTRAAGPQKLQVHGVHLTTPQLAYEDGDLTSGNFRLLQLLIFTQHLRDALTRKRLVAQVCEKHWEIVSAVELVDRVVKDAVVQQAEAHA